MQATIHNEFLTLTVDTHGAEAVSLKNAAGEEMLWQADPAVWKRHAPILFPWTGKLTGGAFTHKGKTYPGGQHGFARAVEHTLLCVDDDMRMEALRQTNYVKSIVTAQGQMDLERKGEQSYQGWMYARLLAFSNGDLQALYDRSDGFYRRQLILTTKDKPLSRVDDPDIAEKMAAEVEGILLWAFEGLQRLVKNGFQFTESDRAKRNRELVKRDNNNVFDFLESEGYIRLKADACTSSKELYEVYKMWCEENSLNAIKSRGFSDALIANQRRYNLESTNNIVNSSGRRVRGFVGIEALVQPDLTPNSWRV